MEKDKGKDCGTEKIINVCVSIDRNGVEQLLQG